MILDLPSLLVEAVGGLLLLASWSDLTTYRIPNWISLTIFGLFPVFAYFHGLSLDVFMWHCIAFSVVLAGGFALFAWNKVGGGDVKLLATVAMWVGWGTPLVQLITVTMILGGVLSLAILLCRWTPAGAVIGTFLRAYGWKFAVFDPAEKMAPYAIAISGAFLVLFFGVLGGEFP